MPLVKRLFTSLFIFSLLSTSVLANTLTQEQQEKGKRALTQARNQIVQMSESEYSQTLLEQADLAREKGKLNRARVLETLASDPESKEEIAEQIQTRIESQSENGILLAYSLITGNSFMSCPSQNYSGCAFLAIVLMIATLDGDRASSF